MGVNSGKFYDAKKMQAYCDMMKKSASNYNDKADLAHSDYNGFHITEKFMGMTADEMKTFIKGGVGGTLKVVSETHRKMRKSQEDVITMFETMVDKSQHARIEYDTLEMINNFYKNLYFELKDRADSVKKLVDGLNDEFGNYAYFEQPDSQSALDAFIDFCGGESDSAGYIRDCQNKFVAFDESAKAYLKGTDTVDRAIKVDTNIVNCATALSAPMENKGTGAKFELLSVKNVKPNKAKDTELSNKKIFNSDGIEKMFNSLQERLKIMGATVNTNRKIGEEYSKIIRMPNQGATIEVSLGTDHSPNRQKAIVASEDVWSVEYTIEDANIKYPPSEYKSTRALNYVVDNYDTNRGEDDVLKAYIEGYGWCYVGAMVEGYGEIGDIVNVIIQTPDGEESIKMLLCDTKNIYHHEKDFKPKTEGEHWQCQNYWGHGYMSLDESIVQLCVCEFVAAGSVNRANAKKYDAETDLLSGSHAIQAEIVGHIDMQVS